MTDKPAYPRVVSLHDRDGNEFVEETHGLTRRELFAAIAMQGMLAGGGCIGARP